MTIAKDESEASSTQRNEAERIRLIQTLGADPDARTQPPHVRAALRTMEKEQKARATRHSRDVVDRTLVDLLSVYRDALLRSAAAPIALVNEDARQVVENVARVFTPEQLLGAVDAIGLARERINANVSPLLALEAMFLSLLLPR